ncbi:PTS transporter subunit EIIC [Listeria ivanovii]|uniref:PTS transporter subunit EIIC n=1 Tax=Listeria ivanovii TaxID=1638 RepID=UPI000674BB8E|nr:PTS transporter subunit EIIC [Listeria ivanovii]MCJ1716508.1 PTS transporter subunit EIIC [Listeria ivanovii]MCJ1721584.1 PTS transporter subunit EIIC [Listeria ivanovii]MCJ1734400.1 PTS transporter subunit EIIC [Listeria ivanovii]
MHFTFVPFLTLIIGVPATILVFGPLANIASSIISSAILGLFGFSPIVTALFVGILYTPLVILGLHWPLVAIGINNLATAGTDYLLPMIFTAPSAQMAVVFAVYLKTKNPDVKKICVPAMVSDFFCIIEPSIYGVTLPVKRRFVYTCIGTAVGALIIAVAGVHNFASTIGVLGIGGFINPQTGDVSYVIVVALASLATMLIAFLLAFFTFKEA